MAEQDPSQNDDVTADAGAPDDAPDSAGKSSLLGKLKVFAFVTVMVLVECLAAYFWLPNAADTAAAAAAALEADSPSDDVLAEEEGDEGDLPVADRVELDLGEFSVTSFQPISNTTLRIDFHLFGTVGLEDENLFLKLMEGNLHRFREQVIVTVRSADLDDLTDAALGLIKRKILEKTNRTLGKPVLRTVIISEFSFIEQ